jgi:outer membrane protein assembly factor BamB
MAAVALIVTGVMLRPNDPSLQTPEVLERQAKAISAHRQAQRERAADIPRAPAATETANPAPQARPTASTYWIDFRGPNRAGEYRQQPILTRWPQAGLTPLWKQPVGAGHASFVIAEGRAYTIEQRGRQEMVVAYDVGTGREVWTNGWDATFNEHYGGAGPRATPTWHEGTLYALGAAGELRALDAASGAVRWRTNTLTDTAASNLEWGMSASPLVVGDNVVTLSGGADGSLLAYDRRNSGRAWSAINDAAAYSSPVLATLAGVEQILVLTATRISGVAVDGSQVLWEFAWPTQGGINASQPLVIGDDRVFVSSGYGMGAVLLEIARDGERLLPRDVWRTNRMKNQFTTSVYTDGYIYGLDDAILACLDANTGELKWKGGRYGYGQILLASGHVLVVTETGDLALVRATPERHDEVARFSALSGRTWNHPAVADGILLVRNGSEMAAFDLRVPTATRR